MHDTHSLQPAGLIPLHGWQALYLACLCGMLAVDHAVAALTAAVLLALCMPVRIGLAMIPAVALGWVLGVLSVDGAQENAWNGTFHIHGRIETVRGYPGGRLNVFVRDVTDCRSGALMPGLLLWTWEHAASEVGVGQEVETTLHIRPVHGRVNFGLPETQEILERQGVHHRAFTTGPVQATWEQAWQPGPRELFMRRVQDALPSGQGGAVVRALLFGDRFLLDPALADRVRRAGLAHSLALSGLHLALVAGLGYAMAWGVTRLCPVLLLYLPRQKFALLLALPCAGAYLWMGGMAPSLLRAAIMLATLIWHQLSGSRRFAQDSLLLAAALLTACDPDAVHDVGLQLSVLAVLGLVVFMPLVQRRLAAVPVPAFLAPVVRGLLTMSATTLSANLFTMPLLAVYFSEIPLAMWTNLLWLPVLGLVVLPLALAGAGCLFIWEGGARILLGLAALGAEGLDCGLQVLDSWGALRVWTVLRPGGLEIVGYWTVLLAAAVLLRMPGPRSVRSIAVLVAGLTSLCLPSLLQGVPTKAEVELIVLDTGMSQAVLLRGPSGHTVLVDGAGAWGHDYDPGRSVVAPALAWEHPPRVDAVLASHVDADHVRGLNHVLRHLDVGWFGWSDLPADAPDARMLRESVAVSGTPCRRLRAGDVVMVEPGLVLQVLHPGADEAGYSANDTSLVVRVVWQGRGLAVLPGDVEQEGIARLLQHAEELRADVLVLPHHGSRSSLSPALYARIAPHWAVSSCGTGNRFGFPHAEVVTACREVGATLLTTARDGALRFVWTGPGRPEVMTARGGRKEGS